METTTANEIDVPSLETEREGYNNTNFALEYPDLDMLDSAANFESNINDDDDDDLGITTRPVAGMIAAVQYSND